MKQAVVTLAIPPNRPTAEISLPNHRNFSRKIGADHILIAKKRWWKGFPTAYFEKIQAFEIGQKYDRIFYLDDDTLVLKNIFDFIGHCSIKTGQFWCNVHPEDLLKKYSSDFLKKFYSDLRNLEGGRQDIFFGTGFWITDSASCFSILKAAKNVKKVVDFVGGEMTWLNAVVQKSKVEICDLPPLLHVSGGFAVYHDYSRNYVLEHGGIIHYAGELFLEGLSKADAMKRDAGHPHVL